MGELGEFANRLPRLDGKPLWHASTVYLGH